MIESNHSIDWTAAVEIFIGSIPTLSIIIIWMWRIEKKLMRFLFEHEILIAWYCKENGLDPKNLPTRQKGL